VANYAAALLIDRDMKLHPEDYQHIPQQGLWFPSGIALVAHKLPVDPPQVVETEEEPENDGIRMKARKAALAWSNDDEDEE
jgi:hypothetical protein